LGGKPDSVTGKRHRVKCRDKDKTEGKKEKPPRTIGEKWGPYAGKRGENNKGQEFISLEKKKIKGKKKKKPPGR